MGLLLTALARRRWDLAAHTIVLATASLLISGERPPGDGKRGKSIKISHNPGADRVVKKRVKRV